MLKGLDAYLMREQEYCDIEEYIPIYCDGCHDNETCEIYLERDCTMRCYMCKHFPENGDTYYDCEFHYECIKLGGVFKPKG